MFRELARQKESQIVEGHLCSDHVHMCVSIPPKFAVSNVIGYLKGKSAISVARNFTARKGSFAGESFWARRYYVSTVGLNEDAVRKYIHEQDAEDAQLEQLNLVHDEKSPSGDSRSVHLGGLQVYAPGFAGAFNFQR